MVVAARSVPLDATARAPTPQEPVVTVRGPAAAVMVSAPVMATATAWAPAPRLLLVRAVVRDVRPHRPAVDAAAVQPLPVVVPREPAAPAGSSAVAAVAPTAAAVAADARGRPTEVAAAQAAMVVVAAPAVAAVPPRPLRFRHRE